MGERNKCGTASLSDCPRHRDQSGALFSVRVFPVDLFDEMRPGAGRSGGASFPSGWGILVQPVLDVQTRKGASEQEMDHKQQ